MTINLSPQQDAALSEIRKWFTARSSPYFILNGYAGTGKTTIAQLLPELLNCKVAYAAFTGKAALQLRRKGCDGATTLHKLLYTPVERNRKKLLVLLEELREALKQDPTAELPTTVMLKNAILHERRELAKPLWQLSAGSCSLDAKLLVVDESSMTSEKMFDDILQLKVPVLFLGDPFQLPPVFGEAPINNLPAQATLTEVHRQALDSPILRAATLIRSGRENSLDEVSTENGPFQIIPRHRADYPLYASADQVLCGRNLTRRALNLRMRRRLVEAGNIESSTLSVAKGDRIVFLRNDHEESVFNGMTAKVDLVSEGGNIEIGNMTLDVTIDDPEQTKLLCYEVWPGIIEEQEAIDAPRKCQTIDFAYALTVHKAQGSEWDTVLVHDENFGKSHRDYLRWLYTAVTRAAKTCIIVR